MAIFSWEPSQEYICDRHHLEWKIRQMKSALAEIEIYRNIIRNAKTVKHDPHDPAER